MVKKLILFDLDGTLIENETIDELAKINNVEDEVKKITKEAMAGNLNFEQSLKKRVSFLKGIPEDKALNTVNNLKITNGAFETIKSLKENGHIVGVVSGGFTIATDEIKKLLNLDYSFANKLIVENNKLTGDVVGKVMKDNAKGEILKEICEKENINLENTVVVGDGANDISMFKIAGFKIAFCAKDKLKKYANVCVDKRDLREILKYIE